MGEISKNRHQEYELTSGSSTAVIFVHGILGSPSQFRFLAESLYKQGMDCRAILLPGHGGSASEFARATAADWQAYVDKSVEDALKTYDRVFIVGHSMGGLLCLNQPNDQVAGIILINTPLVMKISLTQIAMSWRILFNRAEKDDAFLAASRAAFSIHGGRIIDYPIWIRQFAGLLLLARKTKMSLSNFKGKVLLVQSRKDESVHGKSARLLVAGLINATTQSLELRESYHDYFTEPDQEKLFSAAGEFFSSPGRDN